MAKGKITWPMPPTQNTASSAQCPRCGSPWSAKQEFRQYADHMYSSTVGGSLFSISDPQFARVCLCGMLLQPKGYNPRGRLLSPEERSFLESWKKAREYQLLQSEAAGRTQKRLRAAAADPEYSKQLVARIEAAEKLIADLAAELKSRRLKPRRKKTT